MNDKEFAKWLLQIEYLDAEQFQVLASAMAKQAANEQLKNDPAWVEASTLLSLTSNAIGRRAGN